MAADSNSLSSEYHSWDTRKRPYELLRTQRKDTDIAADSTTRTMDENGDGELSEPTSQTTRQRRRLPAWMSCAQAKDGNIQLAAHKASTALVFNGVIEYIHNAAEADFVCETILERQPARLGFDIEWKVTFTRGHLVSSHEGRTALVQLCPSSNRCYLFHVKRMKTFPCKLKEILERRDILKLGIGINGDSSKLHRDYNVHCQGLIDLSCMANKILRSCEKWSLKGLVLHIFHLELSKHSRIRMSNWEVALSPDQQIYAATDAYAGLLIYQKLQNTEAQKQIETK